MDFLKPILWGMSSLELLAILFSGGSVLLANFRKTLQYPVGIIGTVLFFFIFLNFKLYASAGLQVFFTIVQIYGWWYWTNRDQRGQLPRITEYAWGDFVGIVAVGLLVGLGLSALLNQFSDAKVARWDSLIFGLSMAAQFMLDRKKLESWVVWSLVNIISIPVYFSQGLVATSILYAVFLLNTFWGYYLWHKAMKTQDNTQPLETSGPVTRA